MDIKKILFKYGDKAIFIVFLLLLIWSAIRLVSSQPADDGAVTPPRTIIPVDPEIIVASNSRALFQKINMPLYADAGNDIATDPEKLEPGEGEKQCPQCSRILPEDTAKCPQCGYDFKGRTIVSKDKDRDGLLDEWEMKYFGNLDQGPDDDPDGDGYTNKEEHDAGSDPTDPKSIPQLFAIAEIGQQPVDILFKGYIVHDGGDINKPDPAYWAIELNWGRNTQTKILQYGGYFHGYRVYPLEKKVERVFNPALNDWVETDIWFLTIQKKGRKPIVIRQNTEAREQEPYVKLRILRGADKGKTTDKLYDTDKFYANGDEFTVLSVSDKEVIIQDKNQNLIKIQR